MAILQGTDGDDTLKGGLAGDTLRGLPGDDYLYGFGGADFLIGGAGNDFLAGGLGNDIYIRDSAGDVLQEAANAGTDEVRSSFTHILAANFENLVLTGAAGIRGTGNSLANVITGNGADNRISGRGGADDLSGGSGDDTIEGGTGADLLFGGLGDDLFHVLADGSVDAVDDFSKGDLIRIPGLTSAATITAGTGATVLADEIQVSTSSSATTLWIGLDSAPGADVSVLVDSFLGLEDIRLSGSDIITTYEKFGIGGIIDTVIAAVNYSLANFAFVENLTLASTAIDAAGNELDNTLTGNASANSLNGHGGNDVLKGEGGNDQLHGGSGNDDLHGGAGDDRFEDFEGSNKLYGGAGNDLFQVTATAGQSTASGESGRDEYVLKAAASGRLYVVTDFQAGASGDLIDVNHPLTLSAGFGYEGGDPLAAGYLRVIQSGNKALVQWDRDGAGSAYDWRTQITLSGTSASAVTIDNLTGIPPTEELSGDTLTGAGSADLVTGGVFDDHLSGLGGNDTLQGLAGDDLLLGGTEHDSLAGGTGNDTIFGENGNDFIVGAFGDDVLSGGEGADQFEDSEGANLLDGGEGADLFHVFVNAAALDDGGSTVAGGGGRDRYLVAEAVSSWNYLITDFAPGASGDSIDLEELLSTSAAYGYGPLSSLDNFVRLQQPGDDTLIQWDRDGAGGEFDWVTVLALQDVAAASLTPDNFDGKPISGTAQSEHMRGGLGIDTIDGQGGNDTLDGGGAADILDGGDGDDVYFVNHVGDVIIEDPLDLPGGAVSFAQLVGDMVIAAFNYVMDSSRNVENLQLGGFAFLGTGDERANGLAANPLIGSLMRGMGGNDTLFGGSGSDTLNGGAGNDTLIWAAGDYFLGGLGTDTLKIDAGNTDFTKVLNAQIANVERIDLVGNGNNRITLALSDLLDFSTETNSLRVMGDAGDSVNIVGSFTVHGTSGGFRIYKVGTGFLLVDTDITSVL